MNIIDGIRREQDHAATTQRATPAQGRQTMNANQLATVIAALMQPPTNATIATDHGLCLVVADRGHVWVGRARDEGDYTIVSDARIVRFWGTERGLNQIANEGPTEKTKLDDAATVKVARKAVIAVIPCTEAAWSGK